MLSLKFQLTPAQTQMLLVIAYGHYFDLDGCLLPDYESSYFVATGRRLLEKGLVSHDMKRNPTWMVTERGVAIADMITDHARAIVELKESGKTIKPRKGRTTARNHKN